MLVKTTLGKEEVMLCPLCHFTWGVRYRVPLMPDDRKGKPPKFRVMPDPLVEALAKSNWERKQALEFPDPTNRTRWEDDTSDHDAHIRVARETLEPVWEEFSAWFADFFGVSEKSVEGEQTARVAIEEIAIPTLERYEERFDTPDKPRIALQAILNAR